MDREDEERTSPGYLRCKSCGGEYPEEIGVCEDCMLAELKEEESRQEVGWQLLSLQKQEELRLRLEDILADGEGADHLYCPRCLCAHRPGFDRCADCDVPLVDLGRLVELYRPRSLVPPPGYVVCSRCGELVPEDGEVCDDCVLAEGGGKEDLPPDPSALAAVREDLEALVELARRSDVKVCPLCAVEYRSGFDECSDCLVPLVLPGELLDVYNGIASGWTPETDSGGRGWADVWEGEERARAAVAWKLLARLGVEGRISMRLRARDGFASPLFVLWVAEGDAGRAREALAEFDDMEEEEEE